MPQINCSRCNKSITDENGVVHKAAVMKSPKDLLNFQPEFTKTLYGHHDPEKDYYFCAECVLNAFMQN